MSKRYVAVVGTVLAGVAAGALLATRGARRFQSERLVALPVLVPAAESDSPRSTALVPVLSPPATRILTYEAVPAARLGRMPRGIAASIVLIALTLAGLAFARPRIAALAAPAQAYPGTIAVISYASSGLGTLSYDLDAASKTASKTLAVREGTIAVPIVQRDAGHDVMLTLRAAGPFGNDARIARITVLPRPREVVRVVRAVPIRIDALTLSSTVAASGGEIVARYRSNASAGTVTLRDARGGLWKSAPLSPGGATRLRLPVVDRDTPFIVVLHAQRKAESLDASAGVVVSRPSPTPLASPGTAAAGMRTVERSGALWRIEVKPGWTDTVIVLMRRNGSELARLTPQAAGTAELQMPRVSVPQSYLVSVSHGSGSGRETLIHPILVVPAEPVP